MAKYLFKKNDKVWAKVYKRSGLNWRKGIILGRFKNGYDDNMYDFMTNIPGKGFEVLETNLRHSED